MRRVAILGLAVLAFSASSASAAITSWPMWGNAGVGDCAYAAAADWEMAHGGTSATEESILAEYHAVAGAGYGSGITGDQLESIWRGHGIGGKRAAVRDADPERIHSVLRTAGPPIVEMAVYEGQRWGSITDVQGGIHFALVVAVNRRGPVIITWGQRAQLTWWQWREDALLLYLPTIIS